jgi:hypothetical protein
MRKGFAALFVAFAMLVSPAMAAAVGKAAPAGSIHFDVHYGAQGFKIGEARHDWRLAGNKYEMSLNLEAKGLAGLFGLQYEQRSVGTVDAKGMRPERFSVDQRGRKLESAEFDWQAGRVSIRRDGNERRSGSIQPGDQDLLSLWHQARRVADTGKAVKLTVVTNKSVKQATLEPSGTETLKLPFGQVDTLRVRAWAEEGELDIEIWLSQQHGLLPVRIRIEDEKGGVLDQRASRIELGAPAAAAKQESRQN